MEFRDVLIHARTALDTVDNCSVLALVLKVGEPVENFVYLVVKTTFASLNYPLWMLLKRLRKSIFIIS